MTAADIYQALGVSGEVLAYGEKILETLRPRFAEIDARAEINQAKVLAAMQKNRVNATHFAASTGYGYDDEGRDNLERVYASAFHTEAAPVYEMAERWGLGVEETGRLLRYDFFLRTADAIGAQRIATAHHAQDQVTDQAAAAAHELAGDPADEGA